MIHGTDYRQALVARGAMRAVSWLPVREAVVDGVRVLQVWPLTLRRCAECGRLHSLDVVGCS